MSEAISWQVLTSDDDRKFRRRHVTELEAVRSALPWRVVRQAVDDSGKYCRGYPAHILYHASVKDCYALVWLVKADDREPDKLVGYIAIESGKGIRCKCGPPQGADGEHELTKSAKTLGVDEQWEGPCEQGVTGKAKEATRQSEESSSAPVEQKDTVEIAIKEIQEKFTVKPLDTSAPNAEARWTSKRRDLKNNAIYAAEFARLVSRIGREVVNFAFPDKELNSPEWAQISVAAYDLPFYKNYSLYTITDGRGLRSKSSYVVMQRSGEDDSPICYLGRTSAPIIEFNKSLYALGQLQISRDTAADYLVFFCRFVHGELGAFSIIEKEDDLRWLTGLDKSGEDKQRAVAKLLESVRLLTPEAPPEGETENFYYSAFVCYGRDLYYARFKVGQDIMIEMEDDRPCIMDLPIFPAAFDLETDFVLRPRDASSESPA